MKISSCTRTLLRPVWLVRPTGRLLPDRLHRHRPVRPPGATGQTGWSCLLPILVVNICPLFFGKACVPKNTLLDQNYLKAMINNTSAIFCAKGDKKISAMSCFPSSWWWINLLRSPNFLHDYWLCWLDLHLLFHRLLLAQTLQPSFWVWDKPEGHHLGCKYLLSCFMTFSPSLLQLGLLSTRLLLATIGLWEAS